MLKPMEHISATYLYRFQPYLKGAGEWLMEGGAAVLQQGSQGHTKEYKTHRISLQMVVSHHVVSGNRTQDL